MCGVCLRGIDLLLFVDYVAVRTGKKPELDLLDDHFCFSTLLNSNSKTHLLHGPLVPCMGSCNIDFGQSGELFRKN